MLARLLAIAVWLALSIVPASAQQLPPDHIDSRAVLADPSGTLGIEEVARSDFTPIEGILSAGYTDTVHWLRLVVRARPDGGELRLRIRPTYLDELTLYAPDPETAGGWRTAASGDRVPFLDRSEPGVPLGFVITPDGPQTTYYLRLSTTSSSLLHATAMAPQPAYVDEMWIGIIHIIGFSLMAGILLWAASGLIVSRDAVVAWFTLAHTLQLVYFLAISGNLAPILAAFGPIDRLTSLLVCLVPLTTLIFHRVLIRPFAPTAVALRGLDALLLTGAVALLLLLVPGWTRLALQLNAILVLCSAPVFLLLAWTAQSDGPTGRGPLRIAYTLQAIALLITMIPLLGLGGGVEWVLHGTLFPGLMSAVLMFILLNRRARALLNRALGAQIDLGLARQQLAMEQRQREAQGHFLAMLSHELKTPITVARIALGTTRTTGEPRRLIESALDNMNAIVDRCAYADQMDQHELTVVPETCDLAALVGETIDRCANPRRIHREIGALPPFVTDRLLFGVMVSNLLDNALKYSPEGSPVALAAGLCARIGRQGICIRVDNQPSRAGLPDPSRVFGKFYRSSGARSSSGSGLGLYIVRGIAERLGGTAHYASNDGRVRFEIWLPC